VKCGLVGFWAWAWIECECKCEALFILGLGLMKWVSDWVVRKVGLKVIKLGWALARFSLESGRVSLKHQVESTQPALSFFP
jgi:hypothetical protein